MDFSLSDEARMLQDGLRRYLGAADHKAARMGEAGFSPEIWGGLAEMGVIGALFREDDGGFGGAGEDIALVFEEMGRAGAVEPLIETGILGGGLLAACGRSDLVETVIDGSVQLAFAHGEPGGRYAPSWVETAAVRDGDRWSLTGRKAVVANATAADHLLVSARTAGEAGDRDGISLFLVARDAVTARSYPLVGGGMAAEVLLDGAEGALLGEEGAAFAMIETAEARAVLAICAEALGLMEAIRALTADYLRTRKQFEQPLGKFQVLQHRMADMLIEIEQARSAVVNLAGHLDADDRDRHVSATKNLIGNVARLVVEESIQMHGGIGVTEEYDLGHLAKRLSMVDHRFGDALYHLERFIALAVA